ncbi:MAG: biotin/lipoyl-binding protein [Roseiflexaceae bacterium]|nr:biotin/lipoyl-binding protein [Roseiflexaceae bacterium]
MATISARRWLGRRALTTAVGLALVVAACAAAVFFFRGRQQASARSYGLVNPRVDTLIATVNATGQIAPAQTVNLSFAVTGRVAEVLVRPGDAVEKGQPLARLDTRELELRLAQAEAQLAQAQANLDRLLAGPSPAEIAVAEAQLAQAAGQLRQVEGSVTIADVRAAEEQLRQAEARLNQLLKGPRETDVQAAEARVREAELNLERQRTQLSAAKTNAQI